jgi:hypothetical protein
MFGKGALLVPAILNIRPTALNEMLRQTACITLPGIGIATIRATGQFFVHQAKQAVIGDHVATVRRGRQQQQMAFRIGGDPLEQVIPLVFAAFVADTAVGFIDDDKRRASSGEFVATAVGLDVIEAHDRKRIGIEEALRRGKAAFQASGFGRGHCDRIDIEFFGQFGDPLIDEMRRQSTANDQLARDRAIRAGSCRI